mgnify:CR=1 FL=1
MKKTYAGIPEEFAKIEKSSIVLSTVPYDGTSTWQKGADKGPEAFLEASENMELYDIETDSEVYRQGIYLAEPITENATPESMVEQVYATTKSYLLKKKFGIQELINDATLKGDVFKAKEKVLKFIDKNL